jgi:hypothetical protein
MSGGAEAVGRRNSRCWDRLPDVARMLSPDRRRDGILGDLPT